MSTIRREPPASSGLARHSSVASTCASAWLKPWWWSWTGASGAVRTTSRCWGALTAWAARLVMRANRVEMSSSTSSSAAVENTPSSRSPI